MNLEQVDAVAIAAAVRSGEVSAVEVTKAALQRLKAKAHQVKGEIPENFSLYRPSGVG